MDHAPRERNLWSSPAERPLVKKSLQTILRLLIVAKKRIPSVQCEERCQNVANCSTLLKLKLLSEMVAYHVMTLNYNNKKSLSQAKKTILSSRWTRSNRQTIIQFSDIFNVAVITLLPPIYDLHFLCTLPEGRKDECAPWRRRRG